MTLTAGSSLQNGRYIIQTVLRQSDFAVTYQAVHPYLEQTVILQTYNSALRTHSGYEQFCQLFREETRRRVKASDAKPFKVLDAFEEDGLPYVVFDSVPGQTPPKLRDWLPLTKLTAIVEKKAAPSTPTDPTDPPTTLPPTDAHSADAAIAKLEADLALMPTELPDMEPVAVPVNGTNGTNSTNGTNGKVKTPPPAFSVVTPVTSRPGVTRSLVAPSKPRRLPVISMVLMGVAVIGGMAGAGFGWAVRFRQPAEAAKTTGIPESFSNAPLLDFNNEQSFPPQGNWPVQEVRELDLPEESAYEAAPEPQPIYEPEYVRSAPQEPIAVEEPLPEYDPYQQPTQDFSEPEAAIAPAQSEVPSYKPPEAAPAPEYSPLPRGVDSVPQAIPVAPPSKIPLLPPATNQPAALPPS